MGKVFCLEIGPGNNKMYPIDSFIGIDIRRTRETNVIGDARNLPFKNKSFDYVCSRHVIEHFSHLEVKEVLVEWVRVLKIGGTIEILCPDLRARALLFALFPSWKDVNNIYGGQDYPENYHKCGFSHRLLRDLLEELDIVNVKRVYDGYKGIPFIPNCLHVKGIKK